MSRDPASYWKRYYIDIGISVKYIAEYASYIEKLEKLKLPPVFEIDHLCLLLGRNLESVYSMIYSTESYYRTFEIRKKSGGVRQILSPYPSLLECQRWILAEILQKLQISQFATGFRKNYSILKNANFHCGRNKIVKLDIKDFFPSIKFRRVMFVFKKMGYTQDVSFLLSRLCTFDGCLPQGAATSPALSNIICYQMDRRIYGLCKRHRLRYTRYADDITISGNNLDSSVLASVKKIVSENNFELNEKKLGYWI